MSRHTKRKHESSQTGSQKKSKTSRSSGPVAVPKVSVRADALKWRSVQLPDRLDDAEGFFGLEEIEDVDVVTGDQNGTVLFRPKSEKNLVSSELTNSEDAESWSGFRDDVETDSDHLADKQSSKQTTGSKFSTLDSGTSRPELDADLDFDTLAGLEEEIQTDVSAWKSLNLSPVLTASLGRLHFATPTPIQKSAIPLILEGKDVIGKAVTGSGKTLAFGIPIFETWLKSKNSTNGAPIALILAPTRELAHQLTKHLTELGDGMESAPRIATVTGGLSILKQHRLLESANIIIGTPGRLWEVINNSHGLIAKLKQISFLVVDEADRLMSEGHFKEVEEILAAIDRKTINEDDGEEVENASNQQRQTLVFSATFSRELQQKLTSKIRRGQQSFNDLLSNEQSMEYLLRKLSFHTSQPTFIDLNPTEQMAERLDESILECGAMEKDLYLYTLLSQDPAQKVLVFTNSVSSVKRLAPLLQALKQPAFGLHSHMPQKSRLRSLERFGIERKSNETVNKAATVEKNAQTPPQATRRTILIATDVAARGLDIPLVDLVVHYHVPRSADTYVHRSGRTARAGNAGRSILLCSPNEVVPVTRLVAHIHQSQPGNNKKSSKIQIPAMQTLDARLLHKLQSRISLAQKITSSAIAVHQSTTEDAWLRTAAEELGVDYDEDEFRDLSRRQKRGRGATGVTNKGPKGQSQAGRNSNNGVGGSGYDSDEEEYDSDALTKGTSKKSVKMTKATKAQIKQWKAELDGMLDTRMNLGGIRAEKFLAGGAIDVDKLLAMTGSEFQALPRRS